MPRVFGFGEFDVANLARGRSRAPMDEGADARPYDDLDDPTLPIDGPRMPRVIPDPDFEAAYQAHLDAGGTPDDFDWDRWSGRTPVAPAMDGTGASKGMPQGGSWGADYEWSGPEAAGLAWGDHAMPGFNTAGWGSGERGTSSFKNTFGKIASRFDPTQPGALDAIMATDDFKRFFPNAKKVGFDKIDFGDGNPVDVWVAASEGGGGKNWAWQTSGGASAAAGAPSKGRVSDLLTPAAVRAQQPDADLKTWTNPATGQEEWLFMDETGQAISPEAYQRLVQAGRRPPLSTGARRRPGASHVPDLLAPAPPELI